MLPTLLKLIFNTSFTFILSSANAFNLDQSKILSFGKEVKVTQVMKIVCVKEQNFVRKGENTDYQHFLRFQLSF